MKVRRKKFMPIGPEIDVRVFAKLKAQRSISAHNHFFVDGSSFPLLRVVANYVLALQYGVRRLASLPLSLRLIRELHEKLMKGVRARVDYRETLRR